MQKKLCKQKENQFDNWFSDCIADDKYIKERTLELQGLNDNFNAYEKNEKKYYIASTNLNNKLMNFLISNQGILQKDVYAHFDSVVTEDIKTKIHLWSKNGTIKREKSGNTYKIFPR